MPLCSVRHPSVCQSTFHILNFFSRTAGGIYSKYATHVPYEVPTKCCYCLSWSEIHYGLPGLWLADTFWTSSQKWLKGSTPNLPHMFLWGPDQVLLLFKSIWNTIWPLWPLIGGHILNFFSRTVEGIYSKLAKCCYFLNRSEIQYGHHGLWLADTFWTSSQEWLKESTSNLPYMFLMRSWPSVVTF